MDCCLHILIPAAMVPSPPSASPGIHPLAEKRRIVSGSIALMVGTLLSAISSLFLTAYLTRTIPPREVGLFYLIISTGTIAYILSDLGIDSLLMYFVQRYREKEPGIARYVLYRGGQAKVALGAAALLFLLWMGTRNGPLTLGPWTLLPASHYYLYIAAYLVVLLPRLTLLGLLNSIQHFGLSGALRGATSVFTLGMVVGMVQGLGIREGPLLVLGSLLPMGVASLVAFADVIRTVGLEPVAVPTPEIRREARHYWPWLFLPNLLGATGITHLLQVVTSLLSLETAAIFAVGRTLAELVSTLASQVQESMTPTFMKKTDPEDISLAISHSIRYMLLLVLPLAFLAVYTAEPLMLLFYGQAYLPAALVFAILALGYLGTMLFSGITPALVSAGKPNFRVYSVVIFSATVLPLGYLLVPRLQAIGAALALTVGLSMAVLCHIVLCRWLLSFRFPWGVLGRGLLACLAAFPSVNLLPLGPGSRLLVNCLLGLGAYLLVLRAMGELRREDIALLRSSLRWGAKT